MYRAGWCASADNLSVSHCVCALQPRTRRWCCGVRTSSSWQPMGRTAGTARMWSPSSCAGQTAAAGVLLIVCTPAHDQHVAAVHRVPAILCLFIAQAVVYGMPAAYCCWLLPVRPAARSHACTCCHRRQFSRNEEGCWYRVMQVNKWRARLAAQQREQHQVAAAG